MILADKRGAGMLCCLTWTLRLLGISWQKDGSFAIWVYGLWKLYRLKNKTTSWFCFSQLFINSREANVAALIHAA